MNRTRKQSPTIGTALAITALGAAAPLSAQPQSAEGGFIDTTRVLSSTDTLLYNNEFGRPYHPYFVQLRPGQRYDITAESDSLDTFLRAIDEGFNQITDDDGGEGTNARLTFVAAGDVNGDGFSTYQIQVTSFAPGQGGTYHLHGRAGPVGVRLIAVRDSMTLRSIKGQPYASVQVSEAPAGRILVSVDGPLPLPRVSARSRDGVPMDVQQTADGAFEVRSTGEPLTMLLYGFPGGASQAFRLTAYAFPAVDEQAEVHEDTLQAGDALLPAGEYYDLVEVDLQRGESVLLDLESDAFDAYLAVTAPALQINRTDDDGGGAGNSRIDIDPEVWTRVANPPERVTLNVYVTSYAPGETGPWRLIVRRARPEG